MRFTVGMRVYGCDCAMPCAVRPPRLLLLLRRMRHSAGGGVVASVASIGFVVFACAVEAKVNGLLQVHRAPFVNLFVLAVVAGWWFWRCWSWLLPFGLVSFSLHFVTIPVRYRRVKRFSRAILTGSLCHWN